MILKKFLTFSELLIHWNCNKNDIHYLIAEGDLIPSFAWNGWSFPGTWEPNPQESNSLILVDHKDEDGTILREYLSGWVYLKSPKVVGAYKYNFTHAVKKSHALISEFGDTWYRLIGYEDYGVVDWEQIEADAVFMKDEIEDCEIFNSELKNNIKSIDEIENRMEGLSDVEAFKYVFGASEQSTSKKLFDKTSPSYPLELDAAIKAWLAVSSNKEKGKPKAKIRAWLDSHATFKKLSNEAKERIATVANWDKLGGATRTD